MCFDVWISRDKVCSSEAHLVYKKSGNGILKIIKMTLVYMCFSFLESRIWKNLSIVLQGLV